MNPEKLRISFGCAVIYLFCACVLGLCGTAISLRLAGNGLQRTDIATPMYALACGVLNGLILAIPAAYLLSRRLIKR